MGDNNPESEVDDLVGVRRPSPIRPVTSAPPEPLYAARADSPVRLREGPESGDHGLDCRVSGRIPGLRSRSSKSATAIPVSVVSTPFGVP